MTGRLPTSVADGVLAALASAGSSPTIRDATPVTGGCINHGTRLEIEGHGSLFVKWNATAPSGFLEAEAEGLQALRAASSSLRVPEPLATGGGGETPAWLLMEWIPPGAPGQRFDEEMGRGLARMHGTAAGEARFGWDRPNWIGSLPQHNERETSWSTFWRDRRIVPQLERALEAGHFGAADRRTLARLVDRVPAALADVSTGPPHLLHGDLWQGNAFADQNGRPVLIDPAPYHGHGEVDLAMTELFGGFGAAFYAAYAEEGDITDAYPRYRRDLYQLYYLLVHVNLFGRQYEAGTVAAARRVVAELGG